MKPQNGERLPSMQPLTAREEDILKGIDEGLTNRQIAEKLFLSIHTVKWYARQVYDKLGVKNRAEAVQRAREFGLLPADEPRGVLKNNLPVSPTSFVGREEELALLKGLIADPQTPIITIVGPGGIGKTRLALEAAARERRPESHFPDGIFFVSLAPVHSAGELAGALAEVLDFQFQAAGQPARNEDQQLFDYLNNKRMLLVIDNFEHLLEGHTFLTALSDRAAQVKLLVTSRERLLLRGEQLFPLGGLALPGEGDAAEQAPAGQLFLNLAKRVVPDFQLLEEDAEPLSRICRLVDGMPLGLELAAAWAGLLPMSEIAAEIEGSLELLAAEHLDVPPRHRSMQAALNVSWHRLQPQQQRAFQGLTVFRGGFTRAAALEVAGATLPLLVTLNNKSWLTYDREKDRYHIHELLRQFGADRLSVDPDRDAVLRARHSAFFWRYLQEREKDWYGARQREAAQNVAAELANIQAAWRWAVTQSNYKPLASGFDSLGRFYLWEGLKSEGRNVCQKTVEGLSKMIARQIPGEGWYLAFCSRVLTWESDFAVGVDKKETLLSQSQQLLDQASQMGHDIKAEQAFLYLMQANSLVNKDYEKSIELGKRGSELYREMGDPWGESELLVLVGGRQTFQGAFNQAFDNLNRGLQIKKQLRDLAGIGQSMLQLGLLAQHQGHYDEAEKLHRESMLSYRQLGNRHFQSFSLTVLSFTQSWSGNFTAARQSATQSLAYGKDLGDYPNLWSLGALIAALIHLGDYSETSIQAQTSINIALERGHPGEKAMALMNLGQVAYIEKEITKANDCLTESAAILSEIGYVYHPLPRALLSAVARVQGDHLQAVGYLTSALRSAFELRSTTPIMYCLPAAALLAADFGQIERAVELYGVAKQFRHILHSRWFADAVGRELEELTAVLPKEAALAAEERARQRDVWETAESLLAELEGNH